MRIHVTGASGSGTTTLAGMLAEELKYPHFDSDDYFWAPSEVPYTVKRAAGERGVMIVSDLTANPDWVLSGCKANWAEADTDHLPLFNLPGAEDDRVGRRRDR